MADLCAPCTVETFNVPPWKNDFVGWLTGRADAWAWGLCEGCGAHVFDNSGNRLCGMDAGVAAEPCVRCHAITKAIELRELLRTGYRRGLTLRTDGRNRWTVRHEELLVEIQYRPRPLASRWLVKLWRYGDHVCLANDVTAARVADALGLLGWPPGGERWHVS